MITKPTIWTGQPCQQTECSDQAKKRGFCNRHYTYQIYHGLLETKKHNRPDVTYAAVHKRLEIQRGQADAHQCVDCPSRASSWSYSYGDPEQMHEPVYGTPYSSLLSTYDPRCQSCNQRLDGAYRRAVRIDA